MASTKHNLWSGSITELFQSVNLRVACVAVMQMPSVFLVAGQLMIDEMLFRNCFESMTTRNRHQSFARNECLPKRQNGNVRHFLRETRIQMRRKQFHGLRDLQKLASQTMSNQPSGVCLAERLVSNLKTTSKTYAVFN
jgi:hypothetical protein